jgi:SAM-dependent methyltransferase
MPQARTIKLLNLGCGYKTSAHPEVINLDWSIALRFKKNPLLRPFAPLFFRGERWKRYRALPENILVHDLSRGLPFPANSAQAVYHSHLLEHLDQAAAQIFLREIKRVLQPGGVVRIAVPDFEKLARAYLAHLECCEHDDDARARHDAYIAAMIEQCVRREAAGTRKQSPLRRWLENLVLGDARQRGEIHQWMYDRINLGELLLRAGFREPRVQSFDASAIPQWNEYGLERNESGGEYKPDSFYMEASK